MWPMKLDMTRDECRGVLRRLELESYGTVVSTFRAQGCLNKEKLRILEDLRQMLHISNDRHRAEARRVANDERLTTVAEVISGPNSAQDWRREGHRTFPILPRTVPHTALTYIANTVYEQLTRANAKLLHPAETSCDRLRKADEMFRFQLVTKEKTLFENGFVRDAAVVTSDPLQDIMSKSYISTEVKRAESLKPVEATAMESVQDEKRKDVESPEQLPDQPSLCDILLNTSNRSENIANSQRNAVVTPNKSMDRSPRKKNQVTKRSWKSKAAQHSNKPSKNGAVRNVKQSSRANNLHSPHLIHSYAVPFDEIVIPNGGPKSEPLQLQHHLTSNMSPQYGSSNNVNAATLSTLSQPGLNHTPYSHQHGILPSSKKDIQYNLSKLNPTSNVGLKGNLNVSFRGTGLYAHGKPPAHPLLTYQKKSPSKNILIPTSTAAATLASMGLPKPLHPPDQLVSHLNSSINRDVNVKSTKRQNHPDSTAVKGNHSTTTAITSSENTNTISSNSITGSESTSNRSLASSNATSASTLHNVDLKPQENANENASPDQSSEKSPFLNNVQVPKQPNLAGFTAVKSGNKLSVKKLQLVPLGSPVGGVQNSPLGPSTAKSNMFILPKSSTIPGSGMLNLGQKIAIPKGIVESSTASTGGSPPKVIVQTLPNMYNVSSFELFPDQKIISQTSKVADDDQSESVVDSRERSKLTKENVASVQKSTINDSTPVRKIKISTSQLMPYKGTLHTNSFGKDSGSITVGAKKMKISFDAVSGTISTPVASGTDWEHGMDRAGPDDGTESSDADESSTIGTQLNDHSTHQSIDPNHVEIVQSEDFECSNMDNGMSEMRPASATTKCEDKQENELSLTVHGQYTGDTDLSPCHVAADTISHSEYDIISTERGDDSSVTDSADAEDDLDDDEPCRIEEDDGIEEDDYEEEIAVDDDMDTEAVIIEEEPAIYDSLIEEVLEDEQLVEEIEEGRMEFVSVGYGTTRELVAELESTSEQIIEEHPIVNGVIVEDDLPPEIQYDQCSDDMETIENEDLPEQSCTESDGIVCNMLVMDADGKYHTRTYTYDQMIVDGLDCLPNATNRAQKVNPSVG